MSVSFTCKVVAIRPAYDPSGQEMVCIELGYEFKSPSVVASPVNLPAELQMIPQLLQQILPRARGYSNRVVLYLTQDEFEKIRHVFQVGDEFQVRITPNGEITLKKIG